MVWDLRSWCSQCFVAVTCTNIHRISLQRHLLLLTLSSLTSMFWSLTDPRSHLKLPPHRPSSKWNLPHEHSCGYLCAVFRWICNMNTPGVNYAPPKPLMERGFPRRGVWCSGRLWMWFALRSEELRGASKCQRHILTKSATRPLASNPQDPGCM